MFLNTTPSCTCSCCSCCRKYPNTNQDLYIEIRNRCPFHIHVYLNYKVDGEKTTKLSPIFAPGQSQRLTFPFGAEGVVFYAFNCDQTPEGILGNRFIPRFRSSCYEVVGPGLGHIKCQEVAC